MGTVTSIASVLASVASRSNMTSLQVFAPKLAYASMSAFVLACAVEDAIGSKTMETSRALGRFAAVMLAYAWNVTVLSLTTAMIKNALGEEPVDEARRVVDKSGHLVAESRHLVAKSGHLVAKSGQLVEECRRLCERTPCQCRANNVVDPVDQAGDGPYDGSVVDDVVDDVVAGVAVS